MTKQIDREEFEKHLEGKLLEKECEDYLRRTRFRFDWVEVLLTVLITVVTVIGFSSNLAGLIEMVVEHKFAYTKAAINIFWATVFLGQWVYHLAKTLMWKLR